MNRPTPIHALTIRRIKEDEAEGQPSLFKTRFHFRFPAIVTILPNYNEPQITTFGIRNLKSKNDPARIGDTLLPPSFFVSQSCERRS